MYKSESLTFITAERNWKYMANLIQLLKDTKTNFKTSICTHHMLFGEVRRVYRLLVGFFFLFDIGSTASVSASPAIAVSVINKKLSIKEGVNESYAAKPIPSQTHLHIPSESRLSSGEGERLEALLYRTIWHHVRDPRLALSTLAQFSGRRVSWAMVWADGAAQLAGPWLESGST